MKNNTPIPSPKQLENFPTLAYSHLSTRVHQQRKPNPRPRCGQIAKPFTPYPEYYVQTIPRVLRETWRAIWHFGHGNPCQISSRRLAAILGVSVATVRRHIRLLRAGGWLKVKWRRFKDKLNQLRNLPNIYSFPGLEDFFRKPNMVLSRDQEKQGHSLNTNTKAAATLSEKTKQVISYARTRWEWLVKQNHPTEYRENYEKIGQERANYRTKQAMRPDANIGNGFKPEGYYSGQQIAETAEEQAFRERIQAAERASRRR